MNNIPPTVYASSQDVQNIKDKQRELQEDQGETKRLVNFGFFIVILMTGTLILTFFVYIIPQVNSFYKENDVLREQISNQHLNLKILDACLAKKNYWEYKNCLSLLSS